MCLITYSIAHWRINENFEYNSLKLDIKYFPPKMKTNKILFSTMEHNTIQTIWQLFKFNCFEFIFVKSIAFAKMFHWSVLIFK